MSALIYFKKLSTYIIICHNNFNYYIMELFIKEFATEIRLIASFLTIPFIVFWISLAHVYFWGRMTMITKSDRIKNFIAFLTIVGCNFYYFNYIMVDDNLFGRIWRIVIFTSISILFYILIGFKLFSRMDNFLDKHFAKDSNRKKR